MEAVGALARAELMSAVCAVACAALEARSASVAVADDAARELVFVAARGEGSDVVGARFPMAKGLAGRVLATGEPILVEDTSAHPDFAQEIAIASGYEADAMAVVPVTVGGRAAAVLSVLDPAAGILPGTLASLTELAAHAAAGLALAARLEAQGTSQAEAVE